MRAKALGITAPLFDSFPCILDGQHTARLHPMRLKDGKVVWQYASRALGRSVGLNELRGIRAYGADRGMTRQEAARWGERLDFEAGLAWPYLLGVHLPVSSPLPPEIVAQHMELFVGLRDDRWPIDEPFVFARAFGSAYCDLSPDVWRGAMRWLRRERIIVRVGESHRADLWKLAAQSGPARPAAKVESSPPHARSGA